jgi:DNA-binding Lrp family transcriptional regulator
MVDGDRKAYVLFMLREKEDGDAKKLSEKLSKMDNVDLVTLVYGFWDLVAEVNFNEKELDKLDSVVTSIRENDELNKLIYETITYVGAPKYHFQKDISKKYKSYVLAKFAKVGNEKEVMKELSKVEGIAYGTLIYGNWHLMLEIPYDELNELNKVNTYIAEERMLKFDMLMETRMMISRYPKKLNKVVTSP